MNDKQIISYLTPAGHWLKEHLIYFGLFVLCFTIGSLWLIFIDVASTEKSDWETFSAIARNLGLLLLGAIGLPLAFWRSVLAHKQTNIANRNATNAIEQTKIANNNTANALEQTKVTRQGQHADRFAKAAAMLGDNKLPVREAGIFALQELAIADPEGHYFPVQNLLCSFMRDAGQQDREKAGMDRAKPDADAEADATQESLEFSACKSDVITALRAFSDLRTESNMKMEEKRKWRPNLQEANFNFFPGHSNPINLQRANLTEALLQYANLTGAQLHGAILKEAQLQKAVLMRAQLQSANLERAQLQQADLVDAQLQKAVLATAQLQETNLTGANLHGATLIFTQLQRANLTEARLQEADLTGAQLQNASLAGARLREANLKVARLHGAILVATNLQRTDLTGAQLQEADLTGAQLQRADLTGAQLQRADLTGAQLQRADFRRAHFQMIRLSKVVDFTDAKFSPPVWDKSEWPKGWLPSDLQKNILGDYFTFIRAETTGQTEAD